MSYPRNFYLGILFSQSSSKYTIVHQPKAKVGGGNEGKTKYFQKAVSWRNIY